MTTSKSKETPIDADMAVNRVGLDSRTACRAACACVLVGLLALSSMKPVLAADDAQSGGWKVTLGAGAVILPKFPGSRATRSDGAPMIDVQYGRFFLGPRGLGAYLYEDRHLKLGAILKRDFRDPRVTIDDPRLHGLGNINATVWGGMFASYTLGWFTLDGDVRYDLENHHNHEGMIASLKATARYRPLPRLTMTAGPEVTFGNQEYMQTFFGIDALQSLSSGYSVYRPKAGVAYVGLTLGVTYQLTSHWKVAAQADAQKLQGDAARSVIVEKKNQNVFAVFAAYTF